MDEEGSSVLRAYTTRKAPFGAPFHPGSPSGFPQAIDFRLLYLPIGNADMKPTSRASCFVALALIAWTTMPLVAENRLFVAPQTVSPGQAGVEIPILLDNDQALYGFSLSVVTEAGRLTIVGLSLEGTASAGAGWSYGQVFDGGTRIAWGVVMDVESPFDLERVIPVGQGLVLATLQVDVGTQTGTTPIRFQNVVDPLGPGSKNVLAADQGRSVAFTALEGTITVENVGGFVRGNSNGDAMVDISDAVYHLNYLFLGGPEPPCFDASDLDDNGALQITDAIYLLAFLFQGGPDPPAPYPTLGPDPTTDALDC
jgi:hypothetical protein